MDGNKEMELMSQFRLNMEGIMMHGGSIHRWLATALGALGALLIVSCSSGGSKAAAPTTTTTALTASSPSTNTGTPMTFTATVAPSAAPGTVSFYDATTSTVLGSGTLASGQAACQATFSLPGAHSVSATY